MFKIGSARMPGHERHTFHREAFLYTVEERSAAKKLRSTAKVSNTRHTPHPSVCVRCRKCSLLPGGCGGHGEQKVGDDGAARPSHLLRLLSGDGVSLLLFFPRVLSGRFLFSPCLKKAHTRFVLQSGIASASALKQLQPNISLTPDTMTSCFTIFLQHNGKFASRREKI